MNVCENVGQGLRKLPRYVIYNVSHKNAFIHERFAGPNLYTFIMNIDLIFH